MSSEDAGNTAHSEYDLDKEADKEGVLSAENTGNAEGTMSMRIVKNLQAKQVVLGEEL